MAAYPRYRFDRRFDTVPANLERVPEPEPEPDPLDMPRYSERELRTVIAEAEARAFAAGAEQGVAKGAETAEAGIAAHVAEALAVLSRQLESMDGRLAATAAALEAQGAAIIVALVRRLAPALLRMTAREEVERLAGEALRAAGRSPTLRVSVAPALARDIGDGLVAAAGATGRVSGLEVVADHALPAGGIRAEWDTGALVHDPAAVDAAIAELTDRVLAALTPRPA